MIYLIGKPSVQTGEFKVSGWASFIHWISDLTEVEFDIETTVTPWWSTKQIITVQFGWANDQWVLQWSELNDGEKAVIKHYLESKKLKKYIHNALFECVVCLFHSIRILNVYDTMLAEMVLNGGEHLVEYGLDDVCFRYLGISLDKTEQTTFGDNILTPSKIVYAAQDVKHLYRISQLQLKKAASIQYDTFHIVVQLENDCVLAFAEMTYNGMEIDKPWWRELADNATPVVEAARAKMDEWLKTPEFNEVAYQLGYIKDRDQILINWNSGKQKQKIFSAMYPILPGTTKAVLKKWQSDRLLLREYVPEWLPYYLGGDNTPLEKEVLENGRDWLVENGLLIPAGSITINWGSTDQVFPIIKHVEPKIQNLDAETKGRCSHPIVDDLNDYLETRKLLTTYGHAFIDGVEDGPKKKLGKVEPDGRVRTSFKQVLTTGRISSARPNMQNIIVKEPEDNPLVGLKYRNAFLPGPGRKFVSSDYVSQELVEIAAISKEQVWIDALSNGWDLHSICAEMVFKNKWKEASKDDCAYYKMTVGKDGLLQQQKQKCKCPIHKKLRFDTKTVDFGLSYGMSHFKLAGELRITVPEAKKLIEEFFEAFPMIGKLLTYLGNWGVEKGWIQTIKPYYRRRFFPHHHMYVRYIDAHKAGVQYHGALGEIERASKNMPIQGTAGDMVKDAIRRIYYYLLDNNLFSKVKMTMQVHDQLDCAVVDQYAEEWAVIQNRLMEEAALVSIPTGILKSETSITTRWSK